jgi:CheY-like chemotaxis protein
MALAAAAEAALTQASRPDGPRTAVLDPISAATAGRPPKGFRPVATNDDRTPGGDLLQGVRVLVVEDEFLVAIQLEDTLAALGCTVLEPAHSMDEAERALAGYEFDIAVLDINIAGKPIYPIARRLADRGIPIVFTTGYSREHIDEEWRDAPTLRKPYLAMELRRVLEEALGQGQHR